MINYQNKIMFGSNLDRRHSEALIHNPEHELMVHDVCTGIQAVFVNNRNTHSHNPHLEHNVGVASQTFWHNIGANQVKVWSVAS